jgi:hypothetical protein
MRPPSAVWRFALRVLAWLGPCLAAWYLLAPWYDRLPAWLAQGVVGLFQGGLVDGIEFEGRSLTFVTSVLVEAQPGRSGALVVEVNPLVSTYGAPLFAALVLASRGGWARLLAGLAILAPFQAWGIAFDFIASVVRGGLASQAGLARWQAEFAALAYQLGSLLFPTLAPLLAWAALQRETIRELVQSP